MIIIGEIRLCKSVVFFLVLAWLHLIKKIRRVIEKWSFQ